MSYRKTKTFYEILAYGATYSELITNMGNHLEEKKTTTSHLNVGISMIGIWRSPVC